MLGQGGFGEVHLARTWSDGGLIQYVALKLMKPGQSGDPSVERFRDEARLLAELDHPVILVAHDLLELDGRIAMVTEYVEGEDLHWFLRREPRIPPSTVVEVVEAVAHAVDVAWTEAGVVHRDIKPRNIRIGVHGAVKLLDFGIARSDLVTRVAQTRTGILLGTYRYLAPERFTQATADPASDVFALGCVLYEGCVGRPFHVNLEVPQLTALAFQPDAFELHLDQALAEDLRDDVRILLRGMLSWRPDDRPSAHEVWVSCEEIRRGWPAAISLRAFCRTYPWPAPSMRRTRMASPPRRRQDTVASGPPVVSRPWWRLPWVAALAAGVVALLMMLGAGLVVGGARWVQRAPDAAMAQRPGVPATAPPELVPLVSARASQVPDRETRASQAAAPEPVARPPASGRGAAPSRAGEAEGMPDPEPMLHEVTFTSRPLGAKVEVIGGPVLGTTGPLRVSLGAGAHAVRMTLEGRSGEIRQVSVGDGEPNLYVWTQGTDSWEAGTIP